MLFHMIGAVSQYGKIGLTVAGNNRAPRKHRDTIVVPTLWRDRS